MAKKMIAAKRNGSVTVSDGEDLFVFSISWVFPKATFPVPPTARLSLAIGSATSPKLARARAAARKVVGR